MFTPLWYIVSALLGLIMGIINYFALVSLNARHKYWAVRATLAIAFLHIPAAIVAVIVWRRLTPIPFDVLLYFLACGLGFVIMAVGRVVWTDLKRRRQFRLPG